MRNGSWGACGTSTAQFIIHVIHTKASCSEQTQKISISPPSLFFLSCFESLFFINPLYVTSSLLMVLSSYHLTGKLIPVFDCCQPQHNDPYPSPLVLLKLLFPWIRCQDKVIILCLNFWLEFLSWLVLQYIYIYMWTEMQTGQMLSFMKHERNSDLQIHIADIWPMEEADWTLNSENTLVVFSVGETEVLHFCCISELQFYTENKEISG